MGWAIGAVTILLTVPMLVETMARRGREAELPLPAAMLALVLAGIVLVALVRRRWTVVLYLAVAGARASSTSSRSCTATPGCSARRCSC